MKFGLQGIVLVLALIGILAASYFMFFAKANERRAELERDIALKQRELGDLEKSTAGINDVNHKIADLQQAITFFESKLPPRKQVEDVLQEVWHLAEANSLTAKTIKTPKDKRTASYGEQDMEMSLSGNFTGFYTFLLQVEKLPRLTRIKKMNLTKINDRDGDMQAEMILSIYFEPEDPANAGTATAAAH
jgi:type IV pilus assembly protein PilO